MSNHKSSIADRFGLDKLPCTFIITLLIMQVFGLLTLFSASYTTAYAETGNSYSYVFDQLIFTALGEVTMVVASLFDYHLLKRWTNLAYVITLALLVLVLTCSPINGCKRWLNWSGIPIPSIQVSEMAKFVLVLMAAKIISNNWRRRKTIRYGIIAPMVPVFLVFLLLIAEPHFSAIVLTGLIIGSMMLLTGAGGIWSIGAAGLGAGGIWFILSFASKHIEYVERRLDGWTSDISQMTYQTKQSLFAIGSGGFAGLGLGNSMEKQLWLPECTNDFIYSIICEELGFVGAVVTIILFFALIMQGLYIAFTAKDAYGTLIAVGVIAQIAWQAFLNIGVVTNSFPNTGISLPFFSSGGTSLVMLLAEIGVVLNIAKQGSGNRIFARDDPQRVVAAPEAARK